MPALEVSVPVPKGAYSPVRAGGYSPARVGGFSPMVQVAGCGCVGFDGSTWTRNFPDTKFHIGKQQIMAIFRNKPKKHQQKKNYPLPICVS